MKKWHLKNQSGFTIKELLMTFVVIGILCVLAIPPYYMMQESRAVTRMEHVLQKVRVQLSAIYNSKGTFPETLDDDKTSAICQSCFSFVKADAMNQKLWFKKSKNVYYFSPNGAGEAEADFLEKGDYRITYFPKEGRLDAFQNL